ncbi:hypothetical protein MRB53_018755 [Persea americana]|uniref:Uncharacterized protein n=1 Tax=Persea americana TaxID=3435 RepID=A0ACC2M8W4_PERAE|nr:hypothetical protein MRB53_018755 [Persea americana]
MCQLHCGIDASPFRYYFNAGTRDMAIGRVGFTAGSVKLPSHEDFTASLEVYLPHLRAFWSRAGGLNPRKAGIQSREKERPAVFRSYPG